ncbi:MAG TPA: protein kinase, partial [Polyangiaceae bacterium]|nr:protein kinase [Polyangiaceae bacterium]
FTMDDFSERPATPSRIGGLEQLGRFELICVLSRAEYGSSWACMTTAPPNLGKVYSMRRIVVSPGDEDAVAKPILNAASVWEGVTRPGTLPIIDRVESSGRVGIVSEYQEGEPLRSLIQLARLRNAPIPQPVVFRIATDLIQALVNLIGAALRKPELAANMHGGLLPDAVLVTTSGETRLMEPGVTTEIGRIPSLARHEKIIAYQSPELLSDKKIDARSDVFATGVVLWEMLTNKPLFLVVDGATDDKLGEAVAKRVLEEQAPRLDDASMGIAPAISKPLADVVERCLQKTINSRFSSLQDLATQFRKAVGAQVGTRKEVGAYLAELVGSSLETRRSAIERASLNEPREEDSASATRSSTAPEVIPVSVDVDVDIGEGDDLEEQEDLLEEVSGQFSPPVPPPRIAIKQPPSSRKPPPAANAPVTAPKQPSSPPSKPPSDLPPVPMPLDALASLAEDTKSDPASEPTQFDAARTEKALAQDAARQSPPEVSSNPFEQPFAPVAPEKPAPETAPAPEAQLAQSDKTPEPALSAASPEPETSVEAAVDSDKQEPPAAISPTAAFPSLPDTDLEKNPDERKRKMMFIVGGVVAVAALVLVLGLIVSKSGKESTPSSANAALDSTPTTAVPEPVPTPTETPEAAPPDVVEAAADTPKDAAVDAPSKTEKESETAASPKPATTKPAGGRPGGKPKPKPTYTPSGI